MTAPTSRGRVRGLFLDITPLRLDREFRLLWFGQSVSTIGNQMTRLALPFQLYVLTQSTLAIGLLAVVQLVPTIVVVIGAGAIADAFDRRRLLLVTNVGMAASALLLVWLALQDSPPIALLYLAGFLTQAFSSVDQPTRLSAIPRLVPPARLPAAIALNQLSQQGSAIAGPAIAGLFLATTGPAGAYAADAVTFAAAIAALVAMRPLPPLGTAVRPGLAAIREGFRFAARRRVILATFVVDLDAMVFGMPTALFPVLALDVFRTGPAGVGLLAAAPAVGAFVAALLSGWVTRLRRIGLATLAVIAGWGVAITLFGLATFSFAVALALLALAGAADVLSAVFRSTIVQSEAPDELRGRVSAMHVMVVRAGPKLGDLESAAVASVLGAQLAVVSGGLLCLAGLLFVARAFPELARYERASAAPAPVPPTT